MNKLGEAKNAYEIWIDGFAASYSGITSTDCLDLRDVFVAGYLSRDDQACQTCLLSDINLVDLIDPNKWRMYWINLASVWQVEDFDEKIREAVDNVDSNRVEDFIMWLKSQKEKEKEDAPA